MLKELARCQCHFLLRRDVQQLDGFDALNDAHLPSPQSCPATLPEGSGAGKRNARKSTAVEAQLCGCWPIARPSGMEVRGATPWRTASALNGFSPAQVYAFLLHVAQRRSR